MAYTNAWDEDKPDGDAEQLSTADDYLKDHRLDLGERLESMFYGFNADSNAAPENEYGIKHLKLYPQTAAPTTDSDYGFSYGKTSNSVGEFCYKDTAGNECQITIAGALNIAANAIITAKILDANVTFAKLATSAKMSYGTATGSDAADLTVTLPFTPILVLAWNNTNAQLPVLWMTSHGATAAKKFDGTWQATSGISVAGTVVTFIKNADSINNDGATMYYVAFGGNAENPE